jgi:hypothetical protein
VATQFHHASVSDADVDAVMRQLEAEAGSPEGAKRLAVFRSLLTTVAMEAAMVERLERRAFLDEAALSSMSASLTQHYNLAALRSAFAAPSHQVDIDQALGRITELTSALREQRAAADTFTTVARLGVAIARVFV